MTIESSRRRCAGGGDDAAPMLISILRNKETRKRTGRRVLREMLGRYGRYGRCCRDMGLEHTRHGERRLVMIRSVHEPLGGAVAAVDVFAPDAEGRGGVEGGDAGWCGGGGGGGHCY
ncbi:hypothetical protein EX30DRAFT_114154 [Ascodesmis nigricans]|uniref:Uncharacterized protein n=1 Tax=Ascodesmis nigricans TaxID=341454 RepID=A0A4S2MSR2_9PEZI|nr:hypothetical protein EX30DRAFT_114154 [Ascodesmis nigricans]